MIAPSGRWCPTCGDEFRPEVARCPDCDVLLVADAPASHPRDWPLPVLLGGTAALVLLGVVAVLVSFVFLYFALFASGAGLWLLAYLVPGVVLLGVGLRVFVAGIDLPRPRAARDRRVSWSFAAAALALLLGGFIVSVFTGS